MVRATAIPSRSRQLVKARDRWRCARCRKFLNEGGECHHRRSKSVRDAVTHSPCNLIYLCGADHRWVHANPLLAKAEGFIVSRHSDPRKEPLQHALWGLVLLTEQGKFTTEIGATT